MQRLSDLKPGQKATVKEFQKGALARRRIMDMGLVRGARIKILCYAPLGDPIELETHDYKLTLRRKDAECVLVALDGDEEGDQ
jgi:Fe2+ transport system protein FeoA